MTTTTLSSKHVSRPAAALALIGLGLLLISLFVFQPAAAQREPAALKPPFKLIRDTHQQPMYGLPPLPLSAPIIMTETFGSSYVPKTQLSEVGWHEEVGNTTVGYTWARVTTGPHPDSEWQMGRNKFVSGSLTPGVDTYTNGMESLLIYGPVNMDDYNTIVMSATYWLDIQPGDYFGVAVSTDGSTFKALTAESSVDPSLSITRTAYFDLSKYSRQGIAWIAFYFTSNDDNLVDLGTFIDDVVLRGTSFFKVYLPILRLDPTPTPTLTPTPTATPQVTYLDNYTFGSGSSSGSQFLEWGGKEDYSCGSDCDVIQDVSTNGNPSGSINYSAGGFDVLVGTSPNHTIPANFELSADIMLVEGKKDARFGLIFDASSSTFYDDGGDIKMRPQYNYYKFDLNVDPDDETLVRDVRLQRSDDGGLNNLVDRTTLPAQYQRHTGEWNNIRIVRQGSNITVYVNGYAVIVNYDDGTYMGNKKYGVFLHPRAANNNANPLKIRFDNVTVTQLP
jgi:hypothetical protein